MPPMGMNVRSGMVIGVTTWDMPRPPSRDHSGACGGARGRGGGEPACDSDAAVVHERSLVNERARRRRSSMRLLASRPGIRAVAARTLSKETDPGDTSGESGVSASSSLENEPVLLRRAANSIVADVSGSGLTAWIVGVSCAPPKRGRSGSPKNDITVLRSPGCTSDCTLGVSFGVILCRRSSSPNGTGTSMQALWRRRGGGGGGLPSPYGNSPASSRMVDSYPAPGLGAPVVDMAPAFARWHMKSNLPEKFSKLVNGHFP